MLFDRNNLQHKYDEIIVNSFAFDLIHFYIIIFNMPCSSDPERRERLI